MHTLHFRAMGSRCRIVLDGGPDDLIAEARRLVRNLEQKWSRFLEDSEISRLNRNAGMFSVVSPETALLVTRAMDATNLTGGRFNPLMGRQLSRLGYAASWQVRGPAGLARDVWPASEEAIELLRDVDMVRIPAETGFDPGGIGKGLAADLVTEYVANRGATSSSVELGGDVRVNGHAWLGDAWRIDVANPFDDSTDIATFAPDKGAVATSSRLARRWATPEGERHHLLDPVTGCSADTDLVSVTACASTTWWAEVAAKVALMAGSTAAIELLDRFDTPGMIVSADGAVEISGTAHAAEPEMVST